MIRIRNLLTYKAHRNEPVFTNMNAGDNQTPLYMEEAVMVEGVKRKSRFSILPFFGKLVHRVSRLHRSRTNRSCERSDDIDFTVTPL